MRSRCDGLDFFTAALFLGGLIWLIAEIKNGPDKWSIPPACCILLSLFIYYLRSRRSQEAVLAHFTSSSAYGSFNDHPEVDEDADRPEL